MTSVIVYCVIDGDFHVLPVLDGDVVRDGDTWWFGFRCPSCRCDGEQRIDRQMAATVLYWQAYDKAVLEARFKVQLDATVDVVGAVRHA